MLFLVLAIGFLFFEVVGFLVHLAMHSPWTGPVWRAHLTHHRLYGKDPLSDEYQRAGKHSAVRYYLMASVPLVALILWLVPWVYATALLAEMGFLGWLNNELHDASHVRGHWLESYGWFKALRNNHKSHHRHANKNFGLLTLWPDRLFGSYKR